jgi:hypothetical protein
MWNFYSFALGSVSEFGEGGAAKSTINEHPFFAKFTLEQWQYFNDHHLRQFGV